MEESLIIARSIERIVIVIGAFYCFWLAYKFQEGSGAGTALVSWDKFKIELKKIGPSIFFTLLGTLILVISLRSPLEIKTNEGGAREVSYLSLAERNALIAKMSSFSRSVRGLGAYVGGLKAGLTTPQERNNLAETIQDLQSRKADLFEAAFGTETFSKYQDYLNKCSAPSSAECKAAERGFNNDILIRMKDF